eukprot:TRINITY_DN20804_c0_g1_i5.p1 TRINITY_DN20804_c0_g1~~TRINITY_DN20804_c0_g1_i5.p1  ORF type:complete len:448 (+),score=45.86 TRINITY_DN20804_c0_g1_i5:101-1444(+)
MINVVKKRSLLPQAVLVIFLFCWQTRCIFSTDPVPLHEVVELGAEHYAMQWPFVVATAVFCVQFFLCFIALVMLRVIVNFKDPGNAEVHFLGRLREVTCMLTWISAISALYYGVMVAAGSTGMIRAGKAVSMFNKSIAYRSTLRYLLWTFSAPVQWVMFSRLYTQADLGDLVNCALPCMACMLFGAASICADVVHVYLLIRRAGFEARVFFAASFLCLFAVFKRVRALNLEGITAGLGSSYLQVKIILWCCYPLVHVLRDLRFMSAWQEQVLAYTALDMMTKSLSLFASCSGSLVTLFLNSIGNLQLEGGSQDIRITVANPSWIVQDGPSGLSPPGSQQEQLRGRNFLQEVIVGTENQQWLLQMAQLVDSQPKFMAQKLPATVHLAKGEMHEADIYISRSMWGYRQIAIALVSGSRSEGAVASRTATNDQEVEGAHQDPFVFEASRI